MHDVRKYTVYPSNLDILECFKNLKKSLDKLALQEDIQFCDKTSYYLRINDWRNLNCQDFNEFLDVLEKYPSAFLINIHSHFGEKSKDDKDHFGLSIYIAKEYIEITVSAQDFNLISGMHERLSEIFQATNPPIDRSGRLSKYQLKKSIFIAHRFDEVGQKNASTLLKFLTRLGFKVIEGSGYETRDIPEKVTDKIRSQDILICIVTPGDSTWIMGETAFAKALDKYIIILCQDSLNVNKGIIGNDYEHLSFPENNIEKCFSDLLYALPL